MPLEEIRGAFYMFSHFWLEHKSLSELKRRRKNMNAQQTTIETQQKRTVRIAKMGMLVAISIVLVWIIHIPFPAAPFLEYDPADIPILIGTFAFGPLGGVVLTVVTAVIQGLTVSAGGGAYGIIMHIIATGTFVLVAGFIYRWKKSRKTAAIALLCGALAMVAVMIPANIFITPLFMGAPREAVIGMILPVILPFNAMKAGINSVIVFLLYKRISKFLHK